MLSRHRGMIALVSGALAIALFVGACGKKSTTRPVPPGTATLVGKVTLAASAGSPVVGALVKSTSGAATTTDAAGQFTLTLPSSQDVRVDVTKTGFTLNQAHVTLSSNEHRTLAIGLMAAGNTAAVAVGTGGSVTDPTSNAKITLPANFVTASGPVTVSITGLDPTTDQISALPGGLQADDGSGTTKYLKPVSFAEYTVKDAAGNTLQFNNAASSGANIELPIPASLRGQPGYGNGDPIECYVYDPADGKWKTPVPGVIGASSIDGQPAIKATIFHLSWYGGAPATSDIACVYGTVRDSLNTPLPNVNVEAFQGARGTTDASGNYQIQAASHSSVRVVASRILANNVFQTATDTVNTGGVNDPCTAANLVLKSQAPNYEINASMFAFPSDMGPTYSVNVHIGLGEQDATTPIDGADIEIGDGSTFTNVPGLGSGDYELDAFSAGHSDFTLTPGTLYTLRVDYNHDGIVDATGQVRMAGVPAFTSPDSGQVEPKTFTAAWDDAGTGTAGYVPLYFGFNFGADTSSAATSTVFLTNNTSKTIGSGVTDPQTYLPDPPLVAGSYELSLITIVGPLVGGGIPSLPTTPNISGAGTTGTFNAYSVGNAVEYSSSGTALTTSRAAPISAAVRQRAARTSDAFIKRYLGARYTHAAMLERLERSKHGGRVSGRSMATRVRR